MGSFLPKDIPMLSLNKFTRLAGNEQKVQPVMEALKESRLSKLRVEKQNVMSHRGISDTECRSHKRVIYHFELPCVVFRYSTFGRASHFLNSWNDPNSSFSYQRTMALSF